MRSRLDPVADATGSLIEDDVDNYEVVAANIKELYKASVKRPMKVQGETGNTDLEAFMSAIKAQGGGESMNLVASYLKPNTLDYESVDMDYATILHKDVKRTALHLHVLQDRDAVLRSSLYKNPGAPINNVNSNKDNPFHTAATLGRGQVWAKFFLRNNVQINAKNNQGNTVLHLYMLASMDKSERATIIALILQSRPDASVTIKNRDGFDLLALAVIQDVSTIIGLLVKAGATLTDPAFEDGNMILHYAVLTRHIASTQALIDAGAPVDCTNADGATPLILATDLGSKAIMIMLLDGGADIEKRNDKGFGPVETAVRAGKLEPLEILLARGARLTPPEGSTGQNALHLACETGDETFVQFLLTKGGYLLLEWFE